MAETPAASWVSGSILQLICFDYSHASKKHVRISFRNESNACSGLYGLALCAIESSKTPPFLTGLITAWAVVFRREVLKHCLPALFPSNAGSASFGLTPVQALGPLFLVQFLAFGDQDPWVVDGFLVCSLCSPWLCVISRHDLWSYRANHSFHDIGNLFVIDVTSYGNNCLSTWSGDA